MLSTLNPDPSWLNSGDTAWQLTSATLVGIMSIPGLAILYAGLMKRKFAVNSALMVIYAFAMTLVIWMFFAYDMSFGTPLHIGGAATTFVGIPHPVGGANDLEQQASIPLLTGLIPALRFPMSSLVYFQFVFATITVIILGGALLGRISFKAWALFVPLWITLVYSVGAFSLWGGGWLGSLGAVDYSGGYVIHVAAAVSAFVAAAVIGPRVMKDRLNNTPSNIMMAVAGGGLLWLGWSGFNGGDPYFANADASAAVLNTHLCTATALLTWMIMDIFFLKKPTIIGMISGMIAGLVAITPGAGYINAYAAFGIGIGAGILPWLSMNVLGKTKMFTGRVDDTLGRVPHARCRRSIRRTHDRCVRVTEHDRVRGHGGDRICRGDRARLRQREATGAAGARARLHHRVRRGGHLHRDQARRSHRSAAHDRPGARGRGSAAPR